VIEQSGVVMRRRGPTEVLDLATALLRVDAPALTRVMVPLGLVVGTVAAAFWLLEPWVGVLAGVLLGRVAQLPALLAASDRAAGRLPDLRVGRLFRGWLALVPGWFLYGVGYVAGSFLIVVPPYLWVRGLYLPEVVVLERPEGGASARLTSFAAGAAGEAFQTRMWQVALEVWAMGAVALTGEFVLGSLLQLGAPFGSLWEGDASPFLLLGSFLAQPLLSTLRFCSYLDMRTRREGLDAWFLLWSAASAREPG
jgi:hypothetical protein